MSSFLYFLILQNCIIFREKFTFCIQTISDSFLNYWKIQNSRHPYQRCSDEELPARKSRDRIIDRLSNAIGTTRLHCYAYCELTLSMCIVREYNTYTYTLRNMTSWRHRVRERFLWHQATRFARIFLIDLFRNLEGPKKSLVPHLLFHIKNLA